MAKRKTRKESEELPSLITSHLGGIKRALLEGDKRPAFLRYLAQDASRGGIYGLYDASGGLYYVGKASDLQRRINQHLKDRHSESWETMSLFFVSGSANVAELEGLLVATAKPRGNKQRPKVGTDRRKALFSFLSKDAKVALEQAIFPDRKQPNDKVLQRITLARLRNVKQAQLASILGVSRGRISQLFSRGEIRQYIRESGARDRVLAMLEKAESGTQAGSRKSPRKGKARSRASRLS